MMVLVSKGSTIHDHTAEYPYGRAIQYDGVLEPIDKFARGVRVSFANGQSRKEGEQ
jgi:hypothetical protein